MPCDSQISGTRPLVKPLVRGYIIRVVKREQPMRKLYEVLVQPACGEGVAFWEQVEAVNPVQAKRIVESRFPSNWRVNSNARTA